MVATAVRDAFVCSFLQDFLCFSHFFHQKSILLLRNGRSSTPVEFDIFDTLHPEHGCVLHCQHYYSNFNAEQCLLRPIDTCLLGGILYSFEFLIDFFQIKTLLRNGRDCPQLQFDIIKAIKALHSEHC